MPRDKNGCRRETTIEERIRVIQLASQGDSFREIERATGISKATAQRILDRWMREQRVTDLPRPGAPKKLKLRDERYLLQLAQRNPRATLADITTDSRLNVSVRTVGDTLRKHQLYVRICRRKPWLNHAS